MKQPGGDIFVAKILEAGPADDDGFVPHSWQEQRLDPGGIDYVDDEMGRHGTLKQEPAYDLNKASVPADTFVFLRLRGWVDLAAVHADMTSGRVYDILGVVGTGVWVRVVTDINFTTCAVERKWLKVMKVADQEVMPTD